MVEHIVIDGGSSDGTLDVLRRYTHLRIISERDQGLYDALNKGLALATGEIIGVLNSDDLYQKNIFTQIAERFAADPMIDEVCGGASVFEENADGTRRILARYSATRDIEISFHNIIMRVSIVNARFFRRRVYEQLGVYDTRYEIAADREFLLRVALGGARSENLGCFVYEYRQHPGSLTINPQRPQRWKIVDEHLTIAERYLQIAGLSFEERRLLWRWHTREAIVGIKLALRSAKYQEALRYGARMWRFDRQ